MKRICVFCGSSPGSHPEYRAAAEEMAAELVRRNIGLVFGGGNVGLMGIIADAVLRAGGEAVGVIPENLMARRAEPVVTIDDCAGCFAPLRNINDHGRKRPRRNRRRS
jgi:uncharacterized protein (TIGR00730 family)